MARVGDKASGGKCPECGKQIRLTSTGRMRTHEVYTILTTNADGSGTFATKRCRGSLQSPSELVTLVYGNVRKMNHA